MLACIRKKLYLCIAIERNGVKRGLEKDLWNHRKHPSLEVWVSGWNHQFAKLTYGLPYRGFESPRFRKGLKAINCKRRFRLGVRTHASHAWNTGSIPVVATKHYQRILFIWKGFFFISSHKHHYKSTAIRTRRNDPKQYSWNTCKSNDWRRRINTQYWTSKSEQRISATCDIISSSKTQERGFVAREHILLHF